MSPTKQGVVGVSERAFYTQVDWGEAERLKNSTGSSVRKVGGSGNLLRSSADRWRWRERRKSLRKGEKKVLEQLYNGRGADTRGRGTATHGNNVSGERNCVCDYVRICKSGMATIAFSVWRRPSVLCEVDAGD
jgi:hypothetical protein